MWRTGRSTLFRAFRVEVEQPVSIYSQGALYTNLGGDYRYRDGGDSDGTARKSEDIRIFPMRIYFPL